MVYVKNNGPLSQDSVNEGGDDRIDSLSIQMVNLAGLGNVPNTENEEERGVWDNLQCSCLR